MTAGSMRDALAYPAWHAPTTGFARALASRLDLRPVELPWPGFGLDAALAVAPAALRSFRAPTTPVVVLNGRTATTRPPGGGTVVCGVHQDDDAACAAIAGALADALGLHLILVHAVRSTVPAWHAFAALSGMAFPLRPEDVEDPPAGRETVHRVATAAGLGQPGPAEIRVLHGAPGPTIVATARRERAALVVLSASTRGRLQRTLRGSTTGYLIRRSRRPIVVCPRDPAAAMRLREALAPIPARGRIHRR
jgi:nucleotide-binding universal stress UspA family protein